MRSENISIEPEVMEFGQEASQVIKIINHTANSIPNFFFCLYNSEKFTFSPDSFSLAPREHKLITVTLKVKSTRTTVKEFAYLKSTEINKRITLLINQFQSPQAKVRPSEEEGYQDLNTLSSREYRDIQTQAIQKIIEQKQAYIAQLEREKGVNRGPSSRTEESAEKSHRYRRENDDLGLKLALANQQHAELQQEYETLKDQYTEYKKYCDGDLKNYEKIHRDLQDKNHEVERLHKEVEYLEEQGHQFLRKIEEKDEKIRQLEMAKKKCNQDALQRAEKQFQDADGKLQQQKKKYQESLLKSQSRAKELEKKIFAFEEKNSQLEREIKVKEEDYSRVLGVLQSERSTLKALESEKQRMIKMQAASQSLSERNSQLTNRLQEIERMNQNLKQQVYVYKTKVTEQDNSADKMNQYLQIALESCRSENAALKRTKTELEKSLDEFMRLNRQSHDNNTGLSDQLAKCKEEISLLTDIKNGLQRKNQEIKQENHLALMKIKTENVQLLEKMSVTQQTRRNEQIRELEENLAMRLAQIDQYRAQLGELNAKNNILESDNIKLLEKIRKYKKEAKKEARVSSEAAQNQEREYEEKQTRLANKIEELEATIAHLTGKKLERPHSVKRDTSSRVLQPELRRERASSRAIGIKDQRKEIEETQKAISQVSTNEAIELSQLRQLNNYLRNEEDRITRVWKLDQYDADQSSILEDRPAFRCLRFFKRLEQYVRELKGLNQISNVKQIEQLKSRIRELQSIKEDRDHNNMSLSLNKTREQCSGLLQFVREEMKTQYTKLNETIHLWECRHEILKKKIYQQYRAKIIEVLSKKEKNTIPQIQAVLQRFVDGMSNLSHKEAVLNKEVKLKQRARKTNQQLREKIKELDYIVETKKGVCSREPVKLLFNENEIEWQQTLRREAQFLTLTAQYQRIKEELDSAKEQMAQSQQKSQNLERLLDKNLKENQQLQKYQKQLQSNYETEIHRLREILDQTKKKVVIQTKTSSKEGGKNAIKQRQYREMKETIEKQRDTIRTLREKEKMLEQLLEETHRTGERERRQLSEDNRVAETIRDLTENNRQLRAENGRLKERVSRYQDEINKQGLYLKNLKGDIEENRIRVMKKDQLQAQKLKEEIHRLTEEIKRGKEDLDRLRKKRDKDLAEVRNQIDRLRNENLINVKSLESVIRALIDTQRKLYQRIRFIIKKRGQEIQDNSELFDWSEGVQVNALKLDQLFDKTIGLLEEGG